MRRPIWTVTLAALVLFVWLAAGAWAGRLEAFDLGLRAAIHAHSSPVLTTLMRGATRMGAASLLVVLGCAVVGFLLRARRRRDAVLFAVAVLGGEIVNELFKLFFHRPRPEPFFDIPTPSSYSFPSGHALVSVCFYGALAALLASRLRSPVARMTVWLAAAVVAAAVGISRIYLGVHYPSDVLGGYAVAVVWLSAIDGIARAK